MKKSAFLLIFILLLNCNGISDKKQFIKFLISKPEMISNLIMDSSITTDSFRKIYSDSNYKFLIYAMKLRIRNYFQSGYKIIEDRELTLRSPTKLTSPLIMPEYKEQLMTKIKIQGKEDKIIIFYFERIKCRWYFDDFLFDEPEIDAHEN